MKLVNMKKATQLAEEISSLVQAEQIENAYALLAPILAARTPFQYSDRIGKIIGKGEIDLAIPFLSEIAKHKIEGGWVVIGGALLSRVDG